MTKKKATSAPAKKPGKSATSAALTAWAEKGPEPLDAKAKTNIAKLARRQINLERAIQRATEKLGKINEAYAQIRMVDLPEALSAVGLSGFTLKNGEKVELKTAYHCSLAGQYREPAIRWLRKNNLDELVTWDVIASFGKGFEKQAKACLALLSKRKGASVKGVESINTGSFKAVVRELLEAGKRVPVKEIGVTVQESSRIISKPKKATV